MNIDDLLSEGLRLSKRSLLLNDEQDGDVVALWGGEQRQGYSGRANDSHVMTIDCSWLRDAGFDLSGCLSLYQVDSGWEWPVPYNIDYQPNLLFSDLEIADSSPLYGQETQSFPPIQAICLYGGQKVEDWLKEQGLQRTDYDLVENTALAQEYQDGWRNQCPLYPGNYRAVLSGWHMQWPDDDFYMPAEMKLLMWTLVEEPWVELWQRRDTFKILERST